MCGEQSMAFLLFTYRIGSPPRVRGTAYIFVCPVYNGRITPACAGNSVGLPARAADPGDHPRVCGEQAGCSGDEKDFVGSPPRVRGTVDWGICHAKPSRITPACAGNRARAASTDAEQPDHPRVCGEQR